MTTTPTHVFLHIEDDPSVQAMMKRFFQRKYPNAIAFTTDTVMDAIAFFKSVQTDLVVCDFNLKDGHGDEVLAWLQIHQPALVDRFVFLSDDERIKTHKHWIEKPADIHVITAKLAEVLKP